MCRGLQHIDMFLRQLLDIDNLANLGWLVDKPVLLYLHSAPFIPRWTLATAWSACLSDDNLGWYVR